ncbi:MAG: hypothetical protein KDB23_13410 [Planctomycetales bacterium]|nr:hypothetical protein [Planctomycetales bacterium]
MAMKITRNENKRRPVLGSDRQISAAATLCKLHPTSFTIAWYELVQLGQPTSPRYGYPADDYDIAARDGRNCQQTMMTFDTHRVGGCYVFP